MKLIYLLECGGRYKIGISSNIKRRIKDLNNRPFKVNCLAKSIYLKNAYKIEHELHSLFERYRIDGEWFNFDSNTLQYAMNVINGLSKDDEIIYG